MHHSSLPSTLLATKKDFRFKSVLPSARTHAQHVPCNMWQVQYCTVLYDEGDTSSSRSQVGSFSCKIIRFDPTNSAVLQSVSYSPRQSAWRSTSSAGLSPMKLDVGNEGSLSAWTKIFTWIEFSGLAAVANLSKEVAKFVNLFLTSGLAKRALMDFHHLKVTGLLTERIQSTRMSSVTTGCDETLLRIALRSAREVVLPKYDMRPIFVKKLFQLCPYLQSIDIIHPSSGAIKRLKSLGFLTVLTLGKTGFSNIKCSDESISIMLGAVGSHLLELNITKLNCLTVKTLNCISQSCISLQRLSIISCNGIRATSTASTTTSTADKIAGEKVASFVNSEIVNRTIRSIGATILELDLRYSIEMNDGYLKTIQYFVSAKNLKVFTASRTTRTSDKILKSHGTSLVSSCGVPDSGDDKTKETDDQSLTKEVWAVFVDNFRSSSNLLYIDNIGNEGGNEAIFLFNKGKKLTSVIYFIVVKYHLTRFY